MAGRAWRSRLALAAGLLVSFWLGGWGLGRILAHAGRDRGPEAALDSQRLVAACQQALTDRLARSAPTRYGKSFLIKDFGDNRYRVVSHFDQDGGRTRFACDVAPGGTGWEVAELMLVRW